MCLCECQVIRIRVSTYTSARYMLCCCILNPKMFLRVHQFHAYEVKRIHHSVSNVSAVILCITRTYWCT